MTPIPSPPASLVWLRQDLRIEDNPALNAAIAAGGPLAVCHVLDDETPGDWRMGAAQRWWLHESLSALGRRIEALGGALTLRSGAAEQVIPALAKAAGAVRVFWNRCYEPFAVARDTRLKAALAADGIAAASFNASLLFEPWEVRSGEGGPYKTFSSFWRAAQRLGLDREIAPAPTRLPPSPPLASDRLEDWRLQPKAPDWAAGFREAWRPGEDGAREALDRFLGSGLALYAARRDYPAERVPSRLSAHLHFGEIGPRQALAAVRTAAHAKDGLGAASEKFLAEIGWREFAHHVLFAEPTLPEANQRPAFDAFPWRDAPADFRAWSRGRTGYPLVDAGMRELWATGVMHNRVRMVAGSFLVKHLLIDWRQGARWFWDTLVDADLANNTLGWQWVAGVGIDASPYFRIFNPVKQAESFDPAGEYIRKWVSELKLLPAPYVHAPWRAPQEALAKAGVTLGKSYPLPIVDHDEARSRALDAFAALKSR